MELSESDFTTNLIGKSLEDALDKVLTSAHPVTFNDIIQRSWTNPGLTNFRPTIIQGLTDTVKPIVDAQTDLKNIRNSVSGVLKGTTDLQRTGIQYRAETNSDSKPTLMQEVFGKSLNLEPTAPGGNNLVSDPSLDIGLGTQTPSNPTLDPVFGPISFAPGNSGVGGVGYNTSFAPIGGLAGPPPPKRHRGGNMSMNPPPQNHNINTDRPEALDRNAFLYGDHRWPTWGQTINGVWNNLVDAVNPFDDLNFWRH